eukprot:PITA_25181
MNEEYHSLLANDTWDLVSLPKGRKLVRCKWCYKTKFGPDGKVDKHKSCLLAKGFSQVEGIDNTETFSHVAKMNAIHLVLSLAASFKWEVHHMDVKSAFLHGDLHEEIYMEQPIGFIQTNSSLVCQLKKSLYGLKQAPRACDPNLINHVNSNLKNKFEMTNLGHLHYFLSLQVLQSKEGYIFTLGSRPITRACKKQSSISLSSVEVEYRGAIEASKETLWLHQILSEFDFQQQHPTTLWCDNQSAIQLFEDPFQHEHIKHIEIHMHFIGKLIHDHVLEVHYCSTDDQVAYIFAKALTKAKFTKLQFMVGVQEVVTKGG